MSIGLVLLLVSATGILHAQVLPDSAGGIPRQDSVRSRPDSATQDSVRTADTLPRDREAPEQDSVAGAEIQQAPSATDSGVPRPGADQSGSAVQEAEPEPDSLKSSPEQEQGATEGETSPQGARIGERMLRALPWSIGIVGFLSLLTFVGIILRRRRSATASQRAADPILENAENVLRINGIRLTLGNAQALGARAEQQDSFAFSMIDSAVAGRQGGVLVLVADGMGGGDRGGEASQAAVGRFLAAFEPGDAAEPMGSALVRALREANEAVLEIAGNSPNGLVGTTLVAAVVVPQGLHWISVGDSRLYLLRNGRLTRVTTDHNVADELTRKVAKGEVSPEVAAADPERNALTSFLGLEELELIDRNLRTFPLRHGDRLLLCSDGLYNGLSAAELVYGLANGASLDPRALVDAVVAKARQSQDNLTALTVDYEEIAAPSGARRSHHRLKLRRGQR